MKINKFVWLAVLAIATVFLINYTLVGYTLLGLGNVDFTVEDENGNRLEGVTCKVNVHEEFGYPVWTDETNVNGHCSFGNQIEAGPWRYEVRCPWDLSIVASGSIQVFNPITIGGQEYPQTTNKDITLDGCYQGGQEPTTSTIEEAQCTRDEHCGQVEVLRRYCSGENVYERIWVPNCRDNLCYYGEERELIALCSHGCTDGACNPPESTTTVGEGDYCEVASVDCPATTYGPLYCQEDHVLRNRNPYDCVVNECMKRNIPEIVEYCGLGVGCTNGVCNGEDPPTPPGDETSLTTILVLGAGLLALVWYAGRKKK